MSPYATASKHLNEVEQHKQMFVFSVIYIIHSLFKRIFFVLFFVCKARYVGRVAKVFLFFIETHGITSNRFTVDEIAANVTGKDVLAGRNLQVYSRPGDGSRKVSILSPHVDPMMYPMMSNLQPTLKTIRKNLQKLSVLP